MSDLGDSLVGVLIRHRRSASDNAQVLRAQLTQVGNCFFGQAVAEIFLRRIIAHVLERKNRQHDPLLGGQLRHRM